MSACALDVPSSAAACLLLVSAHVLVCGLCRLRHTPLHRQDDQPHYVYSPRELSRWVRGVSEVIKPLDHVELADLVRLWAHEALRLFQDRLVHEKERVWTDALIDSVAADFFGAQLDLSAVLQRPILYSSWLTKVDTALAAPFSCTITLFRCRTLRQCHARSCASASRDECVTSARRSST